METLKFKTTIKCSGCVATVTPALNEVAGENKWRVDLQAPEKFLLIDSDKGLSDAVIIKALESTGYKAERIK